MSFGDRIETRSELEAAELDRENRVSDEAYDPAPIGQRRHVEEWRFIDRAAAQQFAESEAIGEAPHTIADGAHLCNGWVVRRETVHPANGVRVRTTASIGPSRYVYGYVVGYDADLHLPIIVWDDRPAGREACEPGEYEVVAMDAATGEGRC